MLKKLVLLILKLYKILISPALETLFGHACRRRPTCSEYAILSISKDGVLSGGKKALVRFINCNPWFSTYNFKTGGFCTARRAKS